jgi:hypothetical protein
MRTRSTSRRAQASSTFSRIARGGGSIAILAVAATAAAAPAAGTDPRLILDTAFGSQVVRATAGSYCLRTPRPDGTAQGLCADSIYPLRTRGSLTLAGGGALRLVFGGRPTSVHLKLLRSRNPADASAVIETRLAPVHGNRHRYRLRLPRRLPCAVIADVFVRYADGDADFWTALRTPHCVRR